MKMSKELFSELCDSIDQVMEQHSLQKVIELRKNVNFVNNQFISFCWAMFHACKIDCKKFYYSGLNDNHIETALKRILSDFA